MATSRGVSNEGMKRNIEEGRCPLCIGAEDTTQSIG
jgi:hypothetical protein